MDPTIGLTLEVFPQKILKFGTSESYRDNEAGTTWCKEVKWRDSLVQGGSMKILSGRVGEPTLHITPKVYPQNFQREVM